VLVCLLGASYGVWNCGEAGGPRAYTDIYYVGYVTLIAGTYALSSYPPSSAESLVTFFLLSMILAIVAGALTVYTATNRWRYARFGGCAAKHPWWICEWNVAFWAWLSGSIAITFLRTIHATCMPAETAIATFWESVGSSLSQCGYANAIDVAFALVVPGVAVSFEWDYAGVRWRALYWKTLVAALSFAFSHDLYAHRERRAKRCFLASREGTWWSVGAAPEAAREERRGSDASSSERLGMWSGLERSSLIVVCVDASRAVRVFSDGAKVTLGGVDVPETLEDLPFRGEEDRAAAVGAVDACLASGDKAPPCVVALALRSGVVSLVVEACVESQPIQDTFNLSVPERIFGGSLSL
jgi:hypothetical protein